MQNLQARLIGQGMEPPRPAFRSLMGVVGMSRIASTNLDLLSAWRADGEEARQQLSTAA